MSLVLLVILGYVACQLALGAWVSRRVSSQSDYLLGGRSLGFSLCGASMFATWFGAETCVGAASEVSQHGLLAVSADPFGYGICLLLFGFFIAGRLRERGYTTLADLFAERFSPQVERLVALILIPGSVLWAAAQIRAFGHVFAAAGDGLSPDVGIAIAAAVVVAYTSFGGLLADVYTDLLQAIVLIGALVALAVVVFFKLDSVSEVLTTAAAVQPELDHSSPWLSLNAWAVPIAGSLFTQEIISRAVASKTPNIARRAALWAGAVYLVVGLVPVFLGLVSRELLPATDLGEQVLSLLSQRLLGKVGFVIFAGALVSAILSTVDSALLACSALITQNLVPSYGASWSEAQRLRFSRLSVVALGLLAYGLASIAGSVHSLVAESSALGSAGIVVAGLFGMFSRFGGARAAWFALLTGALAYVFAEHVLESEIAYLLSLAGALSGYAIGAVTEPRPVELRIATAELPADGDRAADQLDPID